SKGFGIIHRFSEDIDIRIEPPGDLAVKVGRNQDKPAHVESRWGYYEWLTQNIAIPGIEAVERDTAFDDEKMRSAGIRLRYPNRVGRQAGIKDGILLELGFDDTTPNRPVTISSWAYDAAISAGVQIYDNRAVDVLCYLPTYTFVEKLQTVSTKYRLQKMGEAFPANFMRHYYDIYCLLSLPEVQEFIGTPAYEERKLQRFRRGDELVAAKNPAFLLQDAEERTRFASEYRKTSALYHNGQPDLDEILARIRQHIEKM
ncbi:MAG: nucleotidyl transferase AbiEii/AbiGii toxin family protein, partial [Azonexus sp.]|nr:nucleotidyl transferase AbiEii/AbiGii toxin family protein [Azonexus sp.]